VYTVRVDDVGAAVVSEFSAREKVLPLRKNLDPHHRVIREVMKSTTIVPMTFGHVSKSEDEVVEVLRRNSEGIRSELEHVDGKVEMTLKVKWDVENIFEHFVASNEELAGLRDQIFKRSHAPSQSEKIELGRMFEQQLQTQRESETDRVVAAFQAFCAETKVNPPKGEKAVMEVAFLVERERQKSFEERVYQVAAEFPAHFVFDLSGPWAPFNFVELDLHTATA
jgi:hypothetical protein